MNENYFLNNEPDIKAWLTRLDINQYKINSDMSVNVVGNVNLRNRNFKNIYQYHQEFLKIKEERHHLDSTISASPHPKPPYKI